MNDWWDAPLTEAEREARETERAHQEALEAFDRELGKRPNAVTMPKSPEENGYVRVDDWWVST